VGDFGFNQGLIARRLFVQVVFLSLLGTAVISALQIHFRYDDKLRSVENELQRIETSHLNSLAANLWHMDEALLRTELQGIMNLPNIQFVEVRSTQGQTIALGTPGIGDHLARQHPLVFSHRGILTELGIFAIHADLNPIKSELMRDAAALSLGEAGKIFFIALLVFILFQCTVGRHLRNLTRQALDLDLGLPQSPFHLLRPPRKGKPADELEYLSSSLNGLYASLMATIESLRHTNEKLDQEIGERKKAETALRSSVAEKESLLKEVHHRVKNNLQIISSLLSLQGRKTHNPEALGFLQDAQNRVRSMALLHETLYRSGNLDKVSFPQYVKSICAHLARSCGSVAEGIHLRQDIADVALDIDQAIPAGLIISELVANAFKHAFPSRSEGEISVELQAAGEQHLVLRVSDNGVGFAAETRSQSSETLGLILVKNLSRQLDGQLSIASQQGTVFEIIFPMQAI
jgi:two-component sensor histidine kinase